MSSSTTHLDEISASQASKEVTANALFDAGSPATLFGRRASTSSALTWGYYGGAMWVDGVLTAISNGTVALTGSATNYVESTRAGVVSKNTTAFTAGSIPLYTIVTGVSSVTSYTDHRLTNTPMRGRLSKSVAGSSTTTLSAAEARVDSLVFTGALTGNKAVVVPTVPQRWQVYNNTSGAYTLTIKTSAGTGVVMAQGYRTIVECDGTNVVQCVTDYAAMGLGTAATATLDTDTTLAANSDTRVASQKAVKTYVDTAVTGLLDFKGSADCSANPNYPAASKGDAYVVSVAGKVGGASGKSVDVGDVYVATADNAGGTEASVGTSWSVLEHNLVGALLSANNLSDLASASTARTNLGLGSIATQASSSVSITGGSVTGITDLAVADGGTGASTAREAMAALKGVYILGASAVAASVSATTSEETLATITVPANAMGANGIVRVTTSWSYTNSANSKTLRVRFDGASGTQYFNGVVTTTATARVQHQICNRNSTGSQVGSAPGTTTSWGASANSVATSAVDTTAAVDIVITGQKASSGETITLEYYLVELIVP